MRIKDAAKSGAVGGNVCRLVLLAKGAKQETKAHESEEEQDDVDDERQNGSLSLPHMLECDAHSWEGQHEEQPCKKACTHCTQITDKGSSARGREKRTRANANE